ncbi:PIF1-like helicase [Medicago truncatula]|uniref:PIF1-like helicase n=1 Tax=Medicago truncatula TaxID=3880 RepID=G7KNR6_MEDTR|nr:PIF1-like helicase [Medicago truncatula]
MDMNTDTRYIMNTDTKKQVATLPYQPEFLDSITQVSIPPHILKVKKGAPLMLLRNINPRYGLCNRTRMLCRNLFKNIAFLPIIKLKTNASSRLPFVLSRKQFPVRLSFAITINKSQGHTILNV